MKNKIIALSLLALLLVSGSIYYFSKKQSDTTTYREVKVERGNLSVTILSTGTVQPENRLSIKPPVAGRVERVLVEEGDKIKKGQIIAWMSSTERAALIDAASSKGKEELQQWEEMYKQTPIMSPINGTLIARNVENGQTFAATDAIFVISDRLTIKAQVDETDIARIQLKQSASVVLDAYASKKIPAIVDQIAFDAKTVSNVTTYTVDVLPTENADFMRSGMTANVIFNIASKEGVLFIPPDALKVVNGDSVVSVMNSETKKSEERVVRTGLSDGKKVEVLDGLKEGDILLVPEFKLEGKKASSSPFGGPPNIRQRGK